VSSELQLIIILTHFELCSRLIPINFCIVRLKCVHVCTLYLVPSNICRSSTTVGVANCSYNRVSAYSSFTSLCLIRGRAPQQSVGCRPVMAYTRSRSQVSPRGILGEQVALGQTSVIPHQYHSIDDTFSFTCHRHRSVICN
jgi:hypothetical protein